MGTVDLRCDGTLYGQLTDGRWLEVKCKRRICGYRKGMVILHTIDLQTQKVVSTKRFAEPRNQKGAGNAAHSKPPAVRPA